LNVSYPDFTFDELAFPKLSLPELNQSNFPPSLVTLRVPALRAKLDCHEVAPERIVYDDLDDISIRASANFSLPPNCHRGSQYGNESFIMTETLTWIVGHNEKNWTYVGEYLDVHVGPWDAGRGNSTGIIHLRQPDNPLGCPSAAIAYGRYKDNHSHPSYYSAALCYQRVQTVETDVTLTFPGLKILSAHPPEPDEDTVRNVTIGPNGESAFEWRLQEGFQNSFRIFNSTSTQNITFNRVIDYTGESENHFDQYGFFFGVLAGRTPLSQEEMIDREKFWPHVQMFYRRYMAQTLSDNMRVRLPSSGQYGVQDYIVTTPNITGQLVAEGQLSRLVQHQKPKLALEIMLGVMVVCGILAWTFGQQLDVVPWNPCTIAGVMVLFAGSKIAGNRSQLSQTSLPSDAAHDSSAHPSPRTPSGTILIGTTPSSTNPSDTSPPDAPHPTISPIESSEPSPPNRYGQPRMITPRPMPTTISLIQNPALPDGPASPHSIPRIQVPIRPRQSEVQGAYHIVPIDETSGLDELDTTVILKQAKFRLGWWRGGLFMGKNGPPPVRNENLLIDDISEPIEQDRWRYGIDLMTDSMNSSWQSSSEGMVRLTRKSALAQTKSRTHISLPSQNDSTAQNDLPSQSGTFPTPCPPSLTQVSQYHNHRSGREQRGEPDWPLPPPTTSPASQPLIQRASSATYTIAPGFPYEALPADWTEDQRTTALETAETGLDNIYRRSKK
jgi:hypothetical protein